MNIMSLSRREVFDALKGCRIRFCVIGLGRVGLPMAAILAEVGARVIGTDINQDIVNLINSGKCQLHDEPGLDELVETVVKAGKLRATIDVSSGVKEADVVTICVPTPVDESKVPDYSAVKTTCDNVATTLRKGCLVVVESTVGPGTVEGLVIPTLEARSGMKAGVDFGVASSPERGDPGRMLRDLKKVPRIVGGVDQKSAEVTAAIYKWALGVEVLEVRDPKTANAVKLTENLFRDVNIALANEFAILYKKLGIDAIEVIRACETKYNFTPHYPGAGVGGPCLPQNPYYLIVEGLKVGYIPYLVRMAREINDRMPEHLVMLVTESLNEVDKTVRRSKIAILGVAYKPDIHDLQFTPIEEVTYRLKEMGASITIYDPMFRGEEVFGFRVTENKDKAVRGADCILVGTAHREFQKLDLTNMYKLSNPPAAFVDSRQVVDPSAVKRIGFAFRGVGRP